ncbi:MAG TPA: TrkA family potassium uptake protein [Anaerolineales bacterium]|nr:TrkA family potassium uptake protein [Anaerolineales bacterium]
MKLIIVGCGRVGSELANAVCVEGHEVIVIERDAHAFERLGNDFSGRTIQGDARSDRVLQRAGIEDADGLAAVTSSDMLNLIVARAARMIFKVPNVVARVYDPNHSDVFIEAGLQTVISSSWAANRIEQLLTYQNITELASLGHRDLVLIELQIPPQRAGERLGFLTREGLSQPVGLVRAGQALFAKDDFLLEEGDLVALMVAGSEIDHIEHILVEGEK